MIAVLVWWGTLRPSNDLDWQPDVARLPWAEARSDVLTFHNVRNFDYRSGTDFTPRYEDRVYDLSKLRGLDLFMSYWGSPVIAHTFLSWDFDGSLPLAISIEARKRKGQAYSPVEGFSGNMKSSMLQRTSVTSCGCVPTIARSGSISIA